jgi:hypothetical protein
LSGVSVMSEEVNSSGGTSGPGTGVSPSHDVVLTTKTSVSSTLVSRKRDCMSIGAQWFSRTHTPTC